MKTSLSHLPENKRYEIHRIAEIIREGVNPEKIILFGSHAKGTHVEHRYQSKDGMINEYVSDYDFLVVTNSNSEKSYVQESTVLDRVDRYNPPVNLEIHEIDFINQGLEWGQYFFSDIVKEGILLFDAGNVQFKEPRLLTKDEERKRAEDYFNHWFPKSKEFIIDSKNALDRMSLFNGAFYLHQATESLYYTILLVFTGYKPKTHNLWKLRKKTKIYSEDLFLVFRAETDKQEKHLFELLKQGYVEARYNQKNYDINKELLGELVNRVEIMMSLVSRICQTELLRLQ